MRIKFNLNSNVLFISLMLLLLLPGSFLALLIFLSIAGNILVCVAIYTERSLRRIGNLFLASLAIADLFVASLVMTFAGVNDILGERQILSQNFRHTHHPLESDHDLDMMLYHMRAQ